MSEVFLAAGDFVHDRYRIDAVLGQGGMGAVYEATDTQVARSVAIKEVDATDVPDGPALLEQFATEARMLQGLAHPGLPKVYEFFSEGVRRYLVMELIPGKTLDKLEPDERPSERQVLTWALAIARVLDYLHAQNPPIIFRDLKPGNVMLDTRGQIKLIDFGIAKAYDARTVTKTVIRGAGTPGYAPPEQYFGRTDARTDLYSLGATMYGLLTWRPPPDALSLTTGKVPMVRVRGQAPLVSTATDDLVFYLMQVQRNKRPASAAEVISRLEAVLEPDSAAAVKVSSAAPRRRMLAVLATLVAAALLGLGIRWFRIHFHQ